MGRPYKGSEIIRHKKRIAEMYLYQSMTQAEIGKVLGCSQKTVSKYLDTMQEEWLDSALYDFSKAKIKQLHKIDFLEIEAYNAWKKSIGIKKELTKRSGSMKDGAFENESLKKWKDVGDPRFLERLGWCIAERNRILGFYAPEKKELSGTVATPSTYAEWVKMHEDKKK
jgi:predicted transcriptional regulator